MGCRLSIPQLGDNPVANEKGLKKYYKRYRRIAVECGILLADENRPIKRREKEKAVSKGWGSDEGERNYLRKV